MVGSCGEKGSTNEATLEKWKRNTHSSEAESGSFLPEWEVQEVMFLFAPGLGFSEQVSCWAHDRSKNVEEKLRQAARRGISGRFLWLVVVDLTATVLG